MRQKNSQSARIATLLHSGHSVPEVARMCKVSQRYVYALAARKNCPTNPRIAVWGQREHKLLRDIVSSRACSFNWDKLSSEIGMAQTFLKNFVEEVAQSNRAG